MGGREYNPVLQAKLMALYDRGAFIAASQRLAAPRSRVALVGTRASEWAAMQRKGLAICRAVNDEWLHIGPLCAFHTPAEQ